MQYFSNKNYDSFFKTFANSIYAVFTPVILYKAGVSITMIIFIFMIQFLVMGLFSPLAGTLSKRIGIANTKFISYILKSISMLLVLTVDTNIKYYLVIAVIYGLSGAANNPINTYLPSKIVEKSFMGRFNSFAYILRCFSSIVGYIFTAIFLTNDKSLTIVVAVFISYFLAYLALLNVDKENLEYEMDSSFKDSYSYLIKRNENQKFKIVSGLRSCIIIERLIAVPLYLYISLMNLKTFTTLYVVSTVVELLSLFVSGKKLDKDQIKTFNVISVVKGIITSVFLFAKNTYILMVNQSVYKLVDNVYDSSYLALSQCKVENDRKDTMLLAIVHEMCLCFCEFVILLVLLIISTININLLFKVMFINSIVAILINVKLIKQWNS